MEQTGILIDPAAFQAYTELRKIAAEYNMEDELEVPQLVVVGETSAGKSMLIQNFIRFPCTFGAVDVATRCPVAYRLVHKPNLERGKIRVVQPKNINNPAELSGHLKDVMERIQREEKTGFTSKLYQVELESADYTDFEIVDVPGLITGSEDKAARETVENLVEVYVRNPRFSIVLLKEAGQLKDNATGARCIRELCILPKGRATAFPPRHDYEEHMITIQTKFDTIMKEKNGTAVNVRMQKLCEGFGKTYFVNMIFDGYSMEDNSYKTNVEYIANLPQLEKERVDEWINNVNAAANQSSGNFQKFNSDYRELIGIDVVRQQIQQLWLKVGN
ncbi:unnamed protein product [Adineta steineri]|uniref:Dynamin N-terminal domain-containing protein n=1 Tax=Adineta steineri TaxID=433720 RepID=A0A813SYI5_9BILA|nr:unnamed protein product [Adineta steineri]CAF0802635.1 unnamed protein product [Adineta steineri]CAF3506095.1 unnamed protein product [Adineta steineri]CAF4121620.1 unnamed protein product [Adineta steineri]